MRISPALESDLKNLNSAVVKKYIRSFLTGGRILIFVVFITFSFNMCLQTEDFFKFCLNRRGKNFPLHWPTYDENPINVHCCIVVDIILYNLCSRNEGGKGIRFCGWKLYDYLALF